MSSPILSHEGDDFSIARHWRHTNFSFLIFYWLIGDTLHNHWMPYCTPPNFGWFQFLLFLPFISDFCFIQEGTDMFTSWNENSWPWNDDGVTICFIHPLFAEECRSYPKEPANLCFPCPLPFSSSERGLSLCFRKELVKCLVRFRLSLICPFLPSIQQENTILFIYLSWV